MYIHCNECSFNGAPQQFESEDGDQGYVCPQCGMDESGVVWYCELCGKSAASPDKILHTNELCFK